MKQIEQKLEHLWETIKINFSVDDELTRLKAVAVALAGEAVQCAAVLERFLSTVGGGENAGK